MHPVNYLFEEINRNVWGIPQGGIERKRKHAEKPAWRRLPLGRLNDRS